MTITREINGEIYTFTLTGEELLNAYSEKRKEYAREDVLSVLDLEGSDLYERFNWPIGIDYEHNETIIEAATELYDKVTSDNDCWCNWAYEAIVTAVNDEVDYYMETTYPNPKLSFIDDEEKMRDFPVLTKEEFLRSYSYLYEEEYDATMADYTRSKK